MLVALIAWRPRFSTNKTLESAKVQGFTRDTGVMCPAVGFYFDFRCGGVKNDDVGYSDMA